jgi:hypothetical protein
MPTLIPPLMKLGLEREDGTISYPKLRSRSKDMEEMRPLSKLPPT